MVTRHVCRTSASSRSRVTPVCDVVTFGGRQNGQEGHGPAPLCPWNGNPSQKADRFCSPSHSSGSAMGAKAQDFARMLLTMILDRFLPTGPVVIWIDDTARQSMMPSWSRMAGPLKVTARFNHTLRSWTSCLAGGSVQICGSASNSVAALIARV
jgi:hypothetical protein